MRWVRNRSDLGFVYYEGMVLHAKGGDELDWEPMLVATIYPNDHYRKKWKVQILDHVPYHRPRLAKAKLEAELIYAATR